MPDTILELYMTPPATGWCGNLQRRHLKEEPEPPHSGRLLPQPTLWSGLQDNERQQRITLTKRVLLAAGDMDSTRFRQRVWRYTAAGTLVTSHASVTTRSQGRTAWRTTGESATASELRASESKKIRDFIPFISFDTCQGPVKDLSRSWQAPADRFGQSRSVSFSSTPEKSL